MWKIDTPTFRATRGVSGAGKHGSRLPLHGRTGVLETEKVEALPRLSMRHARRRQQGEQGLSHQTATLMRSSIYIYMH